MSNIKVILYKQKTLKNGLHPVMLYIYEDKVRRLSLGYSCSVADQQLSGLSKAQYGLFKQGEINFDFSGDETVNNVH